MVRCAQKIIFKFFLLFAVKMAVLSVFFLQKIGLGPLGINTMKKWAIALHKVTLA